MKHTLNFRPALLFASFAAAAALQLMSMDAARADEAIAAAPEGQVGIHYWRKDGDYSGWGTHLWESFEKVEGDKVVSGKSRSDQPILGIGWGSPMAPTGKDGFGVYWFVKESEFRNGKVNYIIHKADIKEQCGKDIAFFPKVQGREVFVNSGDCTTWFSADEAMKARK